MLTITNWFTINVSLQCRGSCLTDLLHVCRACINEFSRELVEAHNQITIKDKDIASLEEAKRIIENTLQKTREQMDTLNQRVSSEESKTGQLLTATEKCKALESTIEDLKEEIGRKTSNFETERVSLLQAIEEKENTAKEAEDKLKLLQDSGKIISNITSENYTLRSQLDGLKRLLNESGAGDVARELASSQVRITEFQSLYYQVAAEKTLLTEQLTASDNERTRLVRYQDMCHQQLQAQLRDMEIMNKELVAIKGQLEAERGTVISLQTERAHYLEEKGVLKSIFLRLKNEISKVQSLEATVASITKESSRLAMIAEYNKQLGEQLKEEVVERDQTISKLKSSVDKLQGLQVENAKDKLSLCAELSQVCSLKERLNSSLEKEVKRSRVLDETKKEIEISASAQLKKLGNEQKHERATLKELMKEYKVVLSQRNNLFEAHKSLQLELSKLKDHAMDQGNNCERLCVEISEKELRIRELIGKLQEYEKHDKNHQEELKESQQKHERVMRKMEKVLKQLRKEKEEQDESVTYLKKNIQKLHSDLNDARQSEKETLDKYKTVDDDKHKIVQKFDKTKEEMEKLLNENEKLHEEVKYLSYMYEKVLTDLEASIKASADKEDIFKREIEESKKILITSENHLETISKILYEKDGEISRISDHATTLAKENNTLQNKLQDYKQQHKLLDDIIQAKDKAEKELHKFKRDHENCTLQISSLKKETEGLMAELHASENAKMQLLADNHQLTTRVSTQINQMATEANSSLLSEKLLSTLELLAQEKIAGQEAVRRLTQLTTEHTKLETECEDLRRQNEKLKGNLNEERERVQEISTERAKLQGKVDSMQGKYDQVMNHLRSIEAELREEKLKLQSILSKPPDADSGKVDLKIHQETISALKESDARTDRLKRELEDSHKTILQLRGEISKLEHHVTTLEFQKCELTMRLHETNGLVDTEHNLYLDLRKEQQELITAILQMKDERKIENHDCTDLLRIVHCRSANFIDIT